MKIPISKRLLCCAELVPPCGTVADVGTDHGYLGIYLLREGRCAHVIAADLREKPLASAQTNAALFSVAERMEFVLSDGLHNFQPKTFDALVLAGMGGDLIANILAEAPWLEGGDYTLILQPQSAANDLRRWLGERGWAIRRERLVREHGGSHTKELHKEAVRYVSAHGQALAMKAMLEEKLENMEYLFTKQITATLANNTGPGLLGVMAFIDP